MIGNNNKFKKGDKIIFEKFGYIFNKKKYRHPKYNIVIEYDSVWELFTVFDSVVGKIEFTNITKLIEFFEG